MAIEASDFNDQDILTQTRQEADGKGNVRFKYTLPDGHPITSEWISPDNKKKALMAWLDAVKATAVARGREVEAERNAKLRRAQQEKDPSKNTALPGLIKTDSPPPPDAVDIPDLEEFTRKPIYEPIYPPESEEEPAHVAVGRSKRVPVDPLEFAQDQLRQAEALTVKWRRVIAALES